MRSNGVKIYYKNCSDFMKFEYILLTSTMLTQVMFMSQRI